jgi:hypothetical protein
LQLEVSDEELAKRKAAGKPTEKMHPRGYVTSIKRMLSRHI